MQTSLGLQIGSEPLFQHFGGIKPRVALKQLQRALVLVLNHLQYLLKWPFLVMEYSYIVFVSCLQLVYFAKCLDNSAIERIIALEAI